MKIDLGNMAYKLEWDPEKKEIIKRDLTEEEYARESRYAEEVRDSFLPRLRESKTSIRES